MSSYEGGDPTNNGPGPEKKRSALNHEVKSNLQKRSQIKVRAKKDDDDDSYSSINEDANGTPPIKKKKALSKQNSQEPISLRVSKSPTRLKKNEQREIVKP